MDAQRYSVKNIHLSDFAQSHVQTLAERGVFLFAQRAGFERLCDQVRLKYMPFEVLGLVAAPQVTGGAVPGVFALEFVGRKAEKKAGRS